MGQDLNDSRRLELTFLPRSGSEPPEEESRGLVFHDVSWHWAMLYLHHGEHYWVTHPELASPSREYEEESARYFGARVDEGT